MTFGLFGAITTPLDYAVLAKRAVLIILLVLFWCWETWRPFFGQREGRVKHAVRNLTISIFNTTFLGLVFVSVTVMVAHWTEENQFGLLYLVGLDWAVTFGLALVMLDGWMYFWHRANHAIPFLWRFHQMHHSDQHMDVTTATRFHLGEHIGASVLRLGLIPLLGFEVWHLIVYDTVVIVVTQFHHADISIGRLDPLLSWLIVTPNMHKVHHSDWRPETDSNYSTVLSIWDRLFGSFRMRPNLETLVFGLKDFTAPTWQGIWGMAKTPFVSPTPPSSPATSDKAERVAQESASALVGHFYDQ